MKRLFDKSKCKKGETFVEILIAILIVAFGCMIISTMYSTSMSLNTDAAAKDSAYYDALSEMEMLKNGEGQSVEGSATIKDDYSEETGKNEESLSVGVDVYGSDFSAAYELQKGE